MVDMGGAGGALRSLSLSLVRALPSLVGRSLVVPRDRHRVPVRSARAFGPGGRWPWRELLVPPDRRCGGGGVALWPSLVGRGPTAPRTQRRTLLRDAGAVPGRRWQGGVLLGHPDGGRGGGGAASRPLVGHGWVGPHIQRRALL